MSDCQVRSIHIRRQVRSSMSDRQIRSVHVRPSCEVKPWQPRSDQSRSDHQARLIWCYHRTMSVKARPSGEVIPCQTNRSGRTITVKVRPSGHVSPCHTIRWVSPGLTSRSNQSISDHLVRSVHVRPSCEISLSQTVRWDEFRSDRSHCLCTFLFLSYTNEA
jgi:hypothetical protein